MNRSFRQPWLALLVIIVAAVVVAACGQVTNTELERQASDGLRAAPPTRSWLTQAEVCVDPNDCAPTGAHGKHTIHGCTTCHKVGGRLAFDPAGPAYAAGKPAPAFDATTKTCSNVACHGVPAGTFSYYFPGGDGEVELRTAPYGGNTQPTPSWYATGATCTACHLIPPDAPGGFKYVWHSGFHANQGPTGPANQCSFCHPSTTVHGNGVVDVQARFTSSCFNCH